MGFRLLHQAINMEYMRNDAQNLVSRDSAIEGRAETAPEISSKPTFVIHVGPPKTGTTTIQTNFHDMDEVLKADNYEYRGRASGKRAGPALKVLLDPKQCYEEAMRNQQEFSASPCWRGAINVINEWRKIKKNIFFSDESIAYAHPKGDDAMFYAAIAALKEALADDWNVFVLIGYRRYAEWMLSSVKQIHSRNCASSNIAKWENGFCGAPWGMVKNWMKRTTRVAGNFNYLSTEIVKWNETFPIKILNTHSPGGLLEELVCNILPNAPHTCEYVRKAPEHKDANVRSLARSAYSNIAFAAYEKGLVPPNASRSELMLQLEDYFAERDLSFRHLPHKYCPSQDEAEALLNTSLALEREWMPEWYASPHGEGEHRETFWRLVHDKEFCTVDVDAVTANRTNWKDMLEALARQENAFNR